MIYHLLNKIGMNYLHGCSNNPHGVSILLNNNFEYELLETNRDREGNMLHLLISCSAAKINIINIYAPNQDSPEFFNKIQKITQNNKADYSIICGDFNLVLDPTNDSNNYTRVNNPRAHNIVIEMIDECNLVDAYRYFYLESICFSWRKRNPIKLNK